MEGRDISRRELSQRICGRLDLKSANGRWKDMACRKDLAKLVRNRTLSLPERPCPILVGSQIKPSVPGDPITGSLKHFGPVELVLVEKVRSKLGKIWNELAGHHPLGKGPLCGSQLRYLIRAREGQWLGLLSFSSAAWALEDREKWIGWSMPARKSNLSKVVCNSRFLILPWVKIPHLASHVLSLAAKQLARDWLTRYGAAPVLLETFVEAPYSGRCYAAANWTNIGQTKGRGRQDAKRSGLINPKQIWVYPLRKNFRQVLSEGPPVGTPAIKPRPPSLDWAEEEFGQRELGDQRLNKRLLSLARAFYAQPQASIPQACHGNRAATKAAYRFFEHPQVTMDEILKPHYQSTWNRASKETIVLAVQDTTVLEYRGLEQTEGLGTLGTSKKEGLGLLLHSTLLFNLEGTPLGLIDAQCWARDPAEMGKRYRRRDLPIEKKESNKWLKSFEAAQELQRACPNTQVVSVADRESDVFEFFDLARRSDALQPHLLIRANWNRSLHDEEQLLWERVAGLEKAGELELQVPRQGSQPARVARMEIRFCQVTLNPPKRLRHLKPITLWTIEAREINATVGVTPLLWRLFTTLPVTTLDQALEKLQWYAKRWGIEVFHRTLKSGCKIENRQLGHADRIEACLAIDLVVAWRIFHLCKLGRETPDVPCTVYFEEAEWKGLVAFVTKKAPEKPPTLREAMRMTASLGGFLGRKGDGQPGTQTLWLGLQKLEAIAETWKTFITIYPERIEPTVSSNPTYG